MDLDREIKSLRRELRFKDDACIKAEKETRQLKLLYNKQNGGDDVNLFFLFIKFN